MKIDPDAGPALISAARSADVGTARSVRAPIRRLLADGREILYFDAAPGNPRSAVDERDLLPTVSSSELRLDALTGEWTVIAGQRQDRTFKPSTELCPLCPSQPGRQTEIPESSYEVVVFQNRFPSLAFSTTEVPPEHPMPPFRAEPGIGRCEVVVFTDDHQGSFAALSTSRVATVIDAWVQRTEELSALPGVQYVYCFENRGDEIGVTLAHPHGQIYAYPFVPARVNRSVELARAHLLETGRCLGCDVLAAELTDGRRVVVVGQYWVGYVPFAARWPYELLLMPRRHVGSLPELNAEERAELAGLYLGVLGRFDRLFASPAPYIAGWEQAPRDAQSHLAARVFTIRRAANKLKYLAGSESGATVWVNDISPEDAAARLRGE